MVQNCIYKIRQIDKSTWLELANSFSDYNYRQSWEFGTASARRIGAISEHVVIENEFRDAISIADIRIKKLPIVGGGIAYVNGGPLIVKKNIFEIDNYQEVITALINEYIVKRKLSLRIYPPYLESKTKETVSNILLRNSFYDLNKKKKK